MIRAISDLCSEGRAICYGIVQPGRHVEGGLPILRVANLRGDRIDTSDVMRVDPEIEKKYKRSRIQENDVLVSLVGSMGQVAIAGKEVEGWNLARAVGIVPARDRHHAEWIRYSLQSREAQQFIADHANTTVQATLNLRDLSRLPIPYPDEDARKGILSILTALDDKIELNRRMSATLEEMARALYRSWFVDFDPVHARALGQSPAHMDATTAALFPDSFGPEGLPKGWQRRSLDYIADFLNGAALQRFPPEDGAESLPVIKIAELRSGISVKSARAGLQVPEKYKIINGDVLFSWSGSLLQKVWTEGPGALNQHLFKVSSEIVPKWFHFFAVDQHMKEFRQVAASKATTMGHIQRHHLKEAMIAMPEDDSVLAAAGRLIGPAFDRAIAADLESKTLAALRDTLLPRLMSGELRIREAEKQVEEVV